MTSTPDVGELLRAENASLRARIADLEQQLAAQRTLPYAAIFDQLPLPLVLYQRDGLAVAINQANAELLATPPEAIIGRHNIFNDPEARAKGYVAAFQRALAGAVVQMQPTSYNTAAAQLEGRTADRQFWSETAYFPIHDAAGQLMLVGEVNIDVSDQVALEHERQALSGQLAEREQRFQALFEQNTLGIGLVDVNGYLLDVNPALARLLGYSRDELVGQRINRLTHPDDRDSDEEGFAALLIGQRTLYEVEKRYVRSDGSFIIGRLTNAVVRSAQNEIVFVLRMVQDITAQRAAEAAAQTSQVLLRAVIDQFPALVFVKDLEGRYLMLNQAFADFNGHTIATMRGKTDADLLGPTQAARYNAFDADVIATRRALRREDTHTLKGIEYHYTTIKFPIFDGAGDLAAIGGIAIDISERRRAEEQRLSIERRLRETQRLESLGLLAGGVAHDFNNLLVAILGNASIALEDLPSDSMARHAISQIELAARRAADLTRQLLAYAGKAKPLSQPIALNEFVQEMAQLLYTTVPRQVALHYHLDPQLPEVIGDGSQLRQVVMNLVINAAEAIGVQPGSITIKTGVVQADQDYLEQNFQATDLPSGLYISLTVSDTGAGMSAATLERLFEPFYSTKFTGRGLGLAAVLGIMRSHGGAISVASKEGQGSTFRLLLPASTAPIAEPAPAATQIAFRLSGTALLVDDEEHVRRITRLMLERFGLQVLEAADGAAGLRAAVAHQGPLGIALLDITMPGIGGEELAAQLRTIRPETRILLMSGYSEDAVASRVGQGVIDDFMGKPFTLAELRAALERILT